ncbi:nnp-1 protein putative nuclear protein 1 nop52 [Anaeramoeba flamelloides]|uniref:Nnp-1 protein putative nuclear protein 1 nop52 n=1 Tax=Anaeramoeba flamelloides TaxID=1746091 RepID=A0AAV7ZRJ7_9EUKA|nr:nnp-1 protein putative nuclear protein 1 nop52 [Anaeramoeba flamelloides]
MELSLKDRNKKVSDFKPSSEISQIKGTPSKNSSSSTFYVPTYGPIPIGDIQEYFQKFKLKIINSNDNQSHNKNKNQNQNHNNNQNQNQNKNKYKTDKSNKIFKNIKRLTEISNWKYEKEKDFQIKLMEYLLHFEKDIVDLRFLWTGEIEKRAFYKDKPDFLIVDKSFQFSFERERNKMMDLFEWRLFTTSYQKFRFLTDFNQLQIIYYPVTSQKFPQDKPTIRKGSYAFVYKLTRPKDIDRFKLKQKQKSEKGKGKGKGKQTNNKKKEQKIEPPKVLILKQFFGMNVSQILNNCKQEISNRKILISKRFLDQSFLYPQIKKAEEEEEEEENSKIKQKYYDNLNKLFFNLNDDKPILQNFFLSTKLYHCIPGWVSYEWTQEKQEKLNKANNLPNFNHKKFWLAIIDMVKELHSLNYFHRDLCVSNIMVEKKENTNKNRNTINNNNNHNNNHKNNDNDNDNDNNNDYQKNFTRTIKKNTKNDISTFDYIPKLVDFDSAYLKTDQEGPFHGGTCCLGPRCMIEKQSNKKYRF